MKSKTILLATLLLVGCIMSKVLIAATPACDCRAGGSGQCAPAGGWFPYGGGLLSWWPTCCFPCCGAPDDYRQKPLPNVCWPPYSADYTWAVSESWSVKCDDATGPK